MQDYGHGALKVQATPQLGMLDARRQTCVALCLPNDLCLIGEARAISDAVWFSADIAGHRTSGHASGWSGRLRAGTSGGSGPFSGSLALAL
eukprot:430171-Alexandrium_andersonii.AAC.1